MIFKLLKRDRTCLTALAITPVMAFFAARFGEAMARDPAMDLMGGFMTIQFAMIVLMLTWTQAGVRATAFEMTLPIKGRDLFLARVFSSLIVVWLPAVTAVVTVLVLGSERRSAMEMLGAAPILTLALLLPLATRLPEAAAPAWLARILAGLAAGLGIVSWSFLSTAVTAAIFTVACAGVLFVAWPAIPPSFQLAAADPAKSSSPRRAGVSTPQRFGAISPWMTVLRTAFTGYEEVAEFALMIAGGLFGTWYFFVPMLIVPDMFKRRQRTRWLLALPFSHRALLTITLLSSTAPWACGIAIGAGIAALTHFEPDHSLSGGPTSQASQDVNVSLEYWRYARRGRVPLIRTPWAETIQPATFSALGFTFYNPYSAGPAPSDRLHDWQFERATTAVYGRPISRSEYPRVVDQNLPLIANRPRMQILKLSALLVFSLFVAYAVELTKWRVLHRLSTPALTILYVILFGPPIAALAFGILYTPHFPIGEALTQGLLLRVCERVPNNVALGLAAVIPVVAMYGLLEWQFRRSEFTGKFQQPAGFWGRTA